MTNHIGPSLSHHLTNVLLFLHTEVMTQCVCTWCGPLCETEAFVPELHQSLSWDITRGAVCTCSTRLHTRVPEELNNPRTLRPVRESEALVGSYTKNTPISPAVTVRCLGPSHLQWLWLLLEYLDFMTIVIAMIHVIVSLAL